MVGDRSPVSVLFYPYPGKASIVWNCVAFILAIRC